MVQQRRQQQQQKYAKRAKNVNTTITMKLWYVCAVCVRKKVFLSLAHSCMSVERVERTKCRMSSQRISYWVDCFDGWKRWRTLFQNPWEWRMYRLYFSLCISISLSLSLARSLTAYFFPFFHRFFSLSLSLALLCFFFIKVRRLIRASWSLNRLLFCSHINYRKNNCWMISSSQFISFARCLSTFGFCCCLL